MAVWLRDTVDDPFDFHQIVRDVLFFFNDTATTEIYTLSLHDALPIFAGIDPHAVVVVAAGGAAERLKRLASVGDRKSTRLNSSHANISYAVFCLKKKKID